MLIVAMKKTYEFARRGPDCVTEELAAALSAKVSYDFKSLFDIIYAKLRARKAAGGGEEMLRLRAYEKLQGLVQDGVVKKAAKKYRGCLPEITELGARMKELRLENSQRNLSAPAI